MKSNLRLLGTALIPIVLGPAAFGEGTLSQQQVVDPQLTADGRWFVYVLATASTTEDGMGEAVAVLRSTRNDTERRYLLGRVKVQEVGFKTSKSGQWVAFSVPQAEGSGVAVVESKSGRRRDLKSAHNFRWVGQGAEERLLFESRVQEANELDLTLYQPSSENSRAWKISKEYAVDPSHRRLVWSDAHGLHVHEILSGKTRTLDALQNGTYRHLTWSPSGRALAVLHDGPSVILKTFTGFSEFLKVKKFSSSELKGFPAGYEISVEEVPYPFEQRSALIWREDEEGLFFGIRPQAQIEIAPRHPVPNLVLWHWRDQVPPTAKRRAAEQERLFSYLSYLSLADSQFVRLADETVHNVLPHRRGRSVLGYGTRAYDRTNGLSLQKRDYYLIDLGTGRRLPLVAGLVVNPNNAPRLSPNGEVALYQHNGNYFSYEISTGARRNTTAGLPAWGTLRNPRSLRRMEVWLHTPTWQGWSVDGGHVLLSDQHDVWALPLRGGQSLNLTGNGRRDDIVYMRTAFRGYYRDLSELPNDIVDLKTSLYFTVRERRSGRTGLARYTPGAQGADLLWVDDAHIEYQKASRAEVYLMMRWTANQTALFTLADNHLRPGSKLLDTAQFNRKTGQPGKYLTYTTTDGEPLSAMLFPPRDYVPGRSYPTILWIYEELTQGPHSSSSHFLLDHGYALLLPHITPRLNEAGRAAVECTIAAVDAAVATGMVDRDRLGLYGHSFGGYETFFIATQTDLFKAAVPSAGVTNLWSIYGGMYNGIFRSIAMESNQPFLAGPWWGSWQAYIDNSPLYHVRSLSTPMLIVHGDQDDATPFANALEFFVSAHRLADKPVVLLQYVGDDHISVQPASDSATARDVRARILQFFDHFLKDKSAPDWWTNGISLPQGQVSAIDPSE